MINIANKHARYIHDSHKACVSSLILCRDGVHFLTSSEDEKVNVFDLDTLYKTDTLALPPSVSSPIKCMIMSEDSKSLILGTKNGYINIFNYHLKEFKYSFKAHFNSIEEIALLPGGHFIFTASMDKSLGIFDLNTGTKVHAFNKLIGLPTFLKISPEGRQLICGD